MNQRTVGEWRVSKVEMKVRENGSWFQVEIKGRKFIMKEVPEFRDEKKVEAPKKAPF